MIDIAEKAQIYRISLLSSRVNQILNDVLENKITIAQGSDEYRIIGKAREFLNICIDGGNFAAGQPSAAGFVSSFESLKAYNLVSPTLREEQWRDVTKMLKELENSLDILQNHPGNVQKNKKKITFAKTKFSHLADVMYQRLQEINCYKPTFEFNSYAKSVQLQALC